MHYLTIKKAHNVSGVVRDAEGIFTATFAAALPTNNYIPFGTAQRSSSNALAVTPFTGVKTASFNTTTFKFATSSLDGATARDPITVTLAIIGG